MAATDQDIVDLFKLGGLHLARSDLDGKFLQVVNYDGSVVPVKEIIDRPSAALLPESEDAKKITDARIQVTRTGVPFMIQDVGTPLFDLPGFSHARGVFVPRFKDETRKEIVGCSSLLIDISDEARQLEESNRKLADANDKLQATLKIVQETNKNLEQAMKAKQEFLAMVSHEIRTPLNGIIGMIQLLEQSPLSTSQREYVDTIQRSGQNLLSIINSILDFSKLETAIVNFECNPFDLHRLVNDAVAVVKAQQPLEYTPEFILEICDSAPQFVSGDKVRVFQILTNLIVNAAKFTDRGSITTRVRSDIGEEEETVAKPRFRILVLAEADKPPCVGHKKASETIKVRFEVEDTGIGIPEEFIARLFQPFSQAHHDHARLLGGTGLGLAICKKLVHGMGGEIGAESHQGKGSKFWFILPFHPTTAESISSGYQSHPSHPLIPTPSPTPPHQEAKRTSLKSTQTTTTTATATGISQTIIINVPSSCSASAASAIVTKPRVLVAEDNLVNLKVLVRMLDKLNVSYDCVENGQEAVSMFEINPDAYKALLFDVMMPVLCGDAAAKEIRKWETSQTPVRNRVPIIAVTANVVVGVDASLKESGMDDYLPKPIMLPQLEKMLRKWHVIT